MQEETIFVQTDPTFNLVLNALTELRDGGRLHTTHCQRASIKDIESNDVQEDRRLLFGGQRANMANAAFGQTASAIVRMCMLKAVGIERNFWPQLRDNTRQRNERKLFLEVLMEPLFHLADTREAARNYWSIYDQLYPHFRIEDEVHGLAIGVQGGIPRMMLIFRGNFTRVIEITTTFNATRQGNQMFNSYVNVTCIVRNISEGEDKPDSKFKQLKDLTQSPNIPDQYFKKVREVKNEEAATKLSFLEIEDNEESEEDDKEDNEEDNEENNEKVKKEDNEENSGEDHQ